MYHETHRMGELMQEKYLFDKKKPTMAEDTSKVVQEAKAARSEQMAGFVDVEEESTEAPKKDSLLPFRKKPE